MSDSNAAKKTSAKASAGAGGVRASSEAGRAQGGAGAAEGFDGQYRVELPMFEGPLDLLLHLIQQHELDILDIPVGFITAKYLAYLKLMETLTIDLASEYLVMAATLAHIKSKMLLPAVPAGQEDDGLSLQDEDPRAELVRRLLAYQKYKAAAIELSNRSMLGRDVFPRGANEPVAETPAPFQDLGVFALLDAFDAILKRTKVKLDHEVVFDRISITDRMVELTDRLGQRKAARFEELFDHGGAPLTRFDLIITFLALLEMAKLRVIRVYQSDPLAPIHIELAAGDAGASTDEAEQDLWGSEEVSDAGVAEEPSAEEGRHVD